ncbi:hypothetical protein CCACVL1_29478 [Corchorus capsularis]|uniref:Uncharacterized protein n=1 Tax=Corchorus capsularis TaxID=210143 RepID=A0A1R3G1K8_COCAP|nr:hypothetical protein CCACVL1_29478 [Corchorus capsularis]
MGWRSRGQIGSIFGMTWQNPDY